mmetsp:Transcript_67816/g.196376  ORF Transcript_67816/g.196376 Transcript_67816/m.196376 type:complete len:287 (-) Transcript_67816:914-1774(-)
MSCSRPFKNKCPSSSASTSASCARTQVTTSAVARGPTALCNSATTTLAELRTVSMSSMMACRMAGIKSSKYIASKSFVVALMSSARPIQTPSRTCASPVDKLFMKMGINSGMTRSPNLLTRSPTQRAATRCFSLFVEAKLAINLVINAGRSSFSVRGVFCTTAFQTCAHACLTVPFSSLRTMYREASMCVRHSFGKTSHCMSSALCVGIRCARRICSINWPMSCTEAWRILQSTSKTPSSKGVNNIAVCDAPNCLVSTCPARNAMSRTEVTSSACACKSAPKTSRR